MCFYLLSPWVKDPTPWDLGDGFCLGALWPGLLIYHVHCHWMCCLIMGNNEDMLKHCVVPMMMFISVP